MGFEIDELVYRIECVVDQGRTTQFEEPHTAEGGFESIKKGGGYLKFTLNFRPAMTDLDYTWCAVRCGAVGGGRARGAARRERPKQQARSGQVD